MCAETISYPWEAGGGGRGRGVWRTRRGTGGIVCSRGRSSRGRGNRDSEGIMAVRRSGVGGNFGLWEGGVFCVDGGSQTPGAQEGCHWSGARTMLWRVKMRAYDWDAVVKDGRVSRSVGRSGSWDSRIPMSSFVADGFCSIMTGDGWQRCRDLVVVMCGKMSWSWCVGWKRRVI